MNTLYVILKNAFVYRYGKGDITMGLFEHFPYTNFHELNLDWWIDAMKKLEARVEALEKRIEQLKQEILEEVDRKLAEFKEQLLQEVQEKLDALKEELTTLIDTKISEALAPIIQRIEKLENDLEQLRNDFDECCTEVRAKLSEIETEIDIINGRLDSIDTDISNITTEITTIKERISTIENRLDNDEQAIDDILSSINSINTSIGSINNTISTIQTNINSLGDRVSVLEQQISSGGSASFLSLTLDKTTNVDSKKFATFSELIKYCYSNNATGVNIYVNYDQTSPAVINTSNLNITEIRYLDVLKMVFRPNFTGVNKASVCFEMVSDGWKDITFIDVAVYASEGYTSYIDFINCKFVRSGAHSSSALESIFSRNGNFYNCYIVEASCTKRNTSGYNAYYYNCCIDDFVNIEPDSDWGDYQFIEFYDCIFIKRAILYNATIRICSFTKQPSYYNPKVQLKNCIGVISFLESSTSQSETKLDNCYLLIIKRMNKPTIVGGNVIEVTTQSLA